MTDREKFFLSERERLRRAIADRFAPELSASYRMLTDFFAAFQRERPALDSKEKKAAYFMVLKAVRTAQSIVSLFEDGLVQDAYGLLRPMTETSVDSAYIFMNPAERTARVEAFMAHLPRSMSKLERTRERVLPELGGPRDEYNKQLDAALAQLPAGSERNKSWTRISLEDRIREVDKLLAADGQPELFRFMIAVYGDACQILHSDVAGMRFYMETGAEGDLQFVYIAPGMPTNNLPVLLGLMGLNTVLASTADVLAPGLKPDVEKMAATIKEFYDARGRGDDK